jgi:hypothetical protein
MQSLNNADFGVDISNSFQILVIVHLLKLFILVFFICGPAIRFHRFGFLKGQNDVV